MIFNATLCSIAAPAARDHSGGATTSAPASVNERVNLDKPSSRQLVTLGAIAADVTAVLYVPIAGAEGVVAGAIVRVRLDEVDALDSAGRAFEVKECIPRIKRGGLSHVEAYLKGGR